jgi:simple sugar transport system substrate-binding protein
MPRSFDITLAPVPRVRRRDALVALLAPCLSIGSSRAQGADARPGPLRIGFLYVSPVGQMGWTYEHDQGRLRLEAELAGLVQTTYVEAVTEGADAERVLRDFVARGTGLVFATSFGYQEALLRVAAEAPQVRFEQFGGFKPRPNVSTYNVRMYEARWLSGFLAGQVTRSGVAGYVAGLPVPEVFQGINAFTLGMRAARPDATVRVLWLGTWFDPTREQDAAMTLANLGADVLTHHSGSAAVARAAEQHGVRVIAYQSDMRSVAPHAQLAAVGADWAGYYVREARAVLDGSWRPEPEWGGIREGMVRLFALGESVPATTLAALEDHTRDLRDGRVTPFMGRLVDRAGTVRLESGRLADEAIARMDWFVPGVEGSLPAR